MSVNEQTQFSYMDSDNRKLKVSVERDDANEAESKSPVTTQLHLKSPKPLDREVVIERIQRRKCMNKVKNTFHSLLSLNGSTSTQDHMWVDLGDSFSCP